MSYKSDVQALLDLENRRITAGSTCNVDAMEEIFSDDHVHVHGSGAVDGKRSLIELARRLARHTERAAPEVRIYGDIGILTGPVKLRFDRGQGDEERHFYMTEVAHRSGDKWLFVSIQVTPIAE